MKQKDTPSDDTFQIRCPRLGQQIHFSYCCRENMGLPCFKTLDCWHPYFDVVAYLRNELTAADWQKSFEKEPIPKMLSLAELIDKAQKRAKKQE